MTTTTQLFAVGEIVRLKSAEKGETKEGEATA